MRPEQEHSEAASSRSSTRRDFLADSARMLGGAWIATHLPIIASISACARDAARSGASFQLLTPEEARVVAAFAAQIIPTDDLPGAQEAGAVYFIDQALASYFAGFTAPVRAGITQLNTRASSAGAANFADLSSDAQVEAMRAVEQEPFFGLTRLLVLMGTFGTEERGGNRNGVGFTILSVDHQPSYRPPFGYYDAEAARTAPAGGE